MCLLGDTYTTTRVAVASVGVCIRCVCVRVRKLFRIVLPSVFLSSCPKWIQQCLTSLDTHTHTHTHTHKHTHREREGEIVAVTCTHWWFHWSTAGTCTQCYPQHTPDLFWQLCVLFKKSTLISFSLEISCHQNIVYQCRQQCRQQWCLQLKSFTHWS